MSESTVDKLSRLRMMVSGDDKWDLSDNDIAAIQLGLESAEQLAAAKADVARLTDERDRALAGARASDDERAQAVESMREATAAVERAIAAMRRVPDVTVEGSADIIEAIRDLGGRP